MKKKTLSRIGPAGLVVLFLAVLGLTAVVNLVGSASALAYGQLTTRKIQMSTGQQGATANYLVSFTTGSTNTTGSIVVNFCSESPLESATCSTPGGLSVSAATLTAGTNTSGWTVGTNAAGTFELKGGTAVATNTAVTFTITGATNPSSPGTFYARIYGYNGTAYGGYTDSTHVGTVQDFGGIAMSIANSITTQATVEETLTFCVSKSAPGNGCTSLSTPSLTLGHGSPQVLDSSVVDTDTAVTQITSNAQSGVVVNMLQLGGWSCSGLSKDSGSNCQIAAMGNSFATMSAGSGKFGLAVANGTGGTGTVSADASYGPTGSSKYGYNTALNTTPDEIESSASPTVNVNSVLTFGATAATTTPAGVYSTSESLIATGTF